MNIPSRRIDQSVDYHAFRTATVGGYEFIVSDRIQVMGQAKTNGTTRSAMEFTVKVTAEATGTIGALPPDDLRVFPPATGSTNTKVATCGGFVPPRHDLRCDWTKGRWQIKVLATVPIPPPSKSPTRESKSCGSGNSWVTAQWDGQHGGGFATILCATFALRRLRCRDKRAPQLSCIMS